MGAFNSGMEEAAKTNKEPSNGDFMLIRNYLKRALLAVAACAMFFMVTSTLHAAPVSSNELAPYQTLAKDSLNLVHSGDMKGALNKAEALEEKWDSSELRETLRNIDGQMDVMIDALKSGDAKKSAAEITTYLDMLDKASK